MAEYYTQNFNDLRINGEGQKEEEDKCIPRFYTREIEREGIDVRIEMVEVITAGDRLSRPHHKVTEQDRNRWPRQYAAFKAGLNPDQVGTPIIAWDTLSWQTQNDMRALGFQTVESLASAHDGQLANVPNGTFWRRKAAAFVSSKNAQTSIIEKDRELNELRDRLAKLEAKSVGVDNVSPVLSTSGTSNAPRKAGRPKGSGGKPRAYKARDLGRRTTTSTGLEPSKPITGAT